MGTKPEQNGTGRKYNGPLKLHPMKFEDAVKALLKAKPGPKKPKSGKQPSR
jgi:hypothetical protein